LKAALIREIYIDKMNIKLHHFKLKVILKAVFLEICFFCVSAMLIEITFQGRFRITCFNLLFLYFKTNMLAIYI